MADIVTALAVDSSGNFVVMGYVDSPPIIFGRIGGDHYIAKYAAADGATLWEKEVSIRWPVPFPRPRTERNDCR
jgi:hypothetical protein